MIRLDNNNIVHYAKKKSDQPIKTTVSELHKLYDCKQIDDTCHVWCPGDAGWSIYYDRFDPFGDSEGSDEEDSVLCDNEDTMSPVSPIITAAATEAPAKEATPQTNVAATDTSYNLTVTVTAIATTSPLAIESGADRKRVEIVSMDAIVSVLKAKKIEMTDAILYAINKTDEPIKTTVNELIQMYFDNAITDRAFVWSPGDSTWCRFASKFIENATATHAPPAAASSTASSSGPDDTATVMFAVRKIDEPKKTTVQVLKQLYIDGAIDGSTNVWMPGDAAWSTYDVRFANTTTHTNTSTPIANDTNVSSSTSFIAVLDQIHYDSSSRSNVAVHYYYTTDNTSYLGPYTASDLVELYANSIITDGTYVVSSEYQYKQKLIDSTVYTHLQSHRIAGSTVSMVDDLILLNENRCSDCDILLNTITRVTCLKPHTFVGSMLLSVNPYVILEPAKGPDIWDFIDTSALSKAVHTASYSAVAAATTSAVATASCNDHDDDVLKYRQPHPYAIAEQAYQMLCFTGKDQAILLLGECGSGKTETLKTLTSFITQRDAIVCKNTGKDYSNLMNAVFIVLESFGHANTQCNHNSSRYGAIVSFTYRSSGGMSIAATDKLYWDRCALQCIHVDTYMHEYSRVSQGSNVFHVFFELVASANSICMDRYRHLKIGKPVDHYILHCNSSKNFADSSDVNNFTFLAQAMSLLGITDAEMDEVFAVVAGVIHMGNYCFKAQQMEVKRTFTDMLFSADDKPAEMYVKYGDVFRDGLVPPAAAVLQVNDASLHHLLTEKMIEIVGGRDIVTYHSVQQCYRVKHSIMRALYDALFQFLIHKINASLSSNSSSSDSEQQRQMIRVIDQFGFEGMSVNDFDTLIANYCSEKLQSVVFMTELQRKVHFFHQEGVELAVDKYDTDYRDSLSVIDGRSSAITGIFRLIDDGIYYSNSHQQGYHVGAAVNQSCNSSCLIPMSKKHQQNCFCIQHYTESVYYTCSNNALPDGSTSWCDRNRLFIDQKFVALCKSSGLSIVRAFKFHSMAAADSSPSGSDTVGTVGMTRCKQVEAKMKSIVDSIVPYTDSSNSSSSGLGESCVHTIVCIRPNRDASFAASGYIDKEYVSKQLRGSKVARYCEVERGADNNVFIPCSLIKTMFRSIYTQTTTISSEISMNVFVSCILEAFDIDNAHYRLTHTHLFVKAHKLKDIDRILHYSSCSSSGSSTGSSGNDDRIVSKIVASLNEYKELQVMLYHLEDKVSLIEASFRQSQQYIGTVRGAYDVAVEKVERIDASIVASIDATAIDMTFDYMRQKKGELGGCLSDAALLFVSRAATLKSYHKEAHVGDMLAMVSTKCSDLEAKLNACEGKYMGETRSRLKQHLLLGNSLARINELLISYDVLIGNTNKASEHINIARTCTSSTFQLSIGRDNGSVAYKLVDTVLQTKAVLLEGMEQERLFIESFDVVQCNADLRGASEECSSLHLTMQTLSSMVESIAARLKEVDYIINNPTTATTTAATSKLLPSPPPTPPPPSAAAARGGVGIGADLMRVPMVSAALAPTPAKDRLTPAKDSRIKSGLKKLMAMKAEQQSLGAGSEHTHLSGNSSSSGSKVSSRIHVVASNMMSRPTSSSPSKGILKAHALTQKQQKQHLHVDQSLSKQIDDALIESRNQLDMALFGKRNTDKYYEIETSVINVASKELSSTKRVVTASIDSLYKLLDITE